jgi:hypothetical protein
MPDHPVPAEPDELPTLRIDSKLHLTPTATSVIVKGRVRIVLPDRPDVAERLPAADFRFDWEFDT